MSSVEPAQSRPAPEESLFESSFSDAFSEVLMDRERQTEWEEEEEEEDSASFFQLAESEVEAAVPPKDEGCTSSRADESGNDKGSGNALKLTTIRIAPYRGPMHGGICYTCNNCGVDLYPGNWYQSTTRKDFDLCTKCLQLLDKALIVNAGYRDFVDMSSLLKTRAGFPNILNLTSTIPKGGKYSCACNVCGQRAFFHCNVCADYALCSKHMVTDAWHSHAAHETGATFTNMFASNSIAMNNP